MKASPNKSMNSFVSLTGQQNRDAICCPLSRRYAQAILDSNENFIDQVIDIWSLGQRIYGEAWNTEFHVFGVISSDTDHLPIARVRPLCSEAMLKKSDQELKEIISFYKKDVTKACNEILLKFKDE